MPIVILLLIAILLVLVGGPLALGFFVFPVWLVWASGIIQFLFWAFVASIGLIAVVLIAAATMPRTRTMPVPTNTIPTSTVGRFKCTTCGSERDQAFARCFNCEPFKLRAP